MTNIEIDTNTGTGTRRSTVVSIPFAKLQQNAANVRRTDKGADIESLAEDIAAHGVLQNLNVTECANGKYAVVAGGRRHAALKLLLKQGRIGKDFSVPCNIVPADAAAELSLAENIQRVAMNAMDEMEAFAALADGGMSVEVIASRFGSKVRHVEQRLALGRLSPKLRSAYRRGDINLDVARAFCLTDDHTAQERIFSQFGKPIHHASSVRAALAQGRIPVTDKLVRFVGMETYEASGGKLVRDLFEEDVAYLEDGELLNRLAQQRAETIQGELASEGWGWTEVQFTHGQIEGCASMRLRPAQRPLSPDEEASLASLETEIAEIETALESNDEDEALWDRRDAAEARLDAMRQHLKVWDPKQMALAGAIIAIDRDGAPIIIRGLIKRADLNAVRKLQQADARQTSNLDGGDDAGAIGASEDNSPRLPKALIEDLTKLRTRALRTALAQAPHIALALAVHVLMTRAISSSSVAGVDIASSPIGYADTREFERTRSSLFERHGASDLTALIGQSSADLIELLALLVAETLDVSNQGCTAQDSALQDLGDRLAAALDLDMRGYWKATGEFWQRTPKAFMLEALEANLPQASRKTRMAGFEKLKKSELAAKAAKALRSSGYLPDCLITPPRAGALALTSQGAAAVCGDAAA